MNKDDSGYCRYDVELIEKISAPDGMQGDNWYRYVIGEGKSKIVGMMTGSLKDVTIHVHDVAERLQSRMRGASTVYAQRKKS